MVDVELNRPSASPEKNAPERNVFLSTSPNPLHSAAPSKLANPQDVIAVLASPQNLGSAPTSELKTTPKGPLRLSPAPAVVESAASQIVHRALKAMDTTVNPQSVRSAFKQETNFILDKARMGAVLATRAGGSISTGRLAHFEQCRLLVNFDDARSRILMYT